MIQNNSSDILLNVCPVPKPRMTRSDKWKKRDCVVKYFDFADELRREWGDRPIPNTLHVIFFLPMPKSWPNKKRIVMTGTPHQSKPDTDNLMKAFKDALCSEDSHIWDERGTKIWANQGSIIVRNLPKFT